MAAALASAAASTTNRGKSSSYFEVKKGNRAVNPVFQALESEISLILSHIRKRADPNYVIPENEAHCRISDSIFEIWNRYQPKLSNAFYHQKLLEMGDNLLSMKEYQLALWQCYERYLLPFKVTNIDQITDGQTLEKVFFPNGFDTENSGSTFRALMGKCISMYQVIKMKDEKLQNKQSVDECIKILSFLRLIMQIVMPRERLCWLIYNGSIHIYTISRHLMSLGHSAQVLDFVIWSSVCMESSIPLMSVKYLPWRSTLYTAVCQCYYDCKAGQHGEAFARRGLTKINELSQLEKMSNAEPDPKVMVLFRHATLRMAVMVFKRSVFETRRKPKGLLRPKTRTNYKDVINVGWPRTTTEKMMAEMFEGSAAQFLALLESLSDSNRRILQTMPPAQDSEPEVLDVFVELFMAGQELLAGGGGKRLSGPKAQTAIGSPPLCGIDGPTTFLMDAAVLGEDGIPVSAAIKFVKLAYNYEHWDVFDSLVEPMISYLTLLNNEAYFWDEKALELILAMEKLNPNKKHNRKNQVNAEGSAMDEEQAPPTTIGAPNTASLPGTSMKSTGMHDDHINLADVLMSIISGNFSRDQVEIDIIIDATLFLWNKCKVVFQKYQTGSVDNPRYLFKMDQPYKWMYLLDTVHQSLCWCGVSSVDPALTAEVVLRLALVYESSAYLSAMDAKRKKKKPVITEDGKPSSQPSSCSMKGDKSGLKDSKTTLTDICPTDINHSRISMLSTPGNMSTKAQLLLAKTILELGLKNMASARQTVLLNDGKSVADVCWVKELNPDVFRHLINHERSEVGEEMEDPVPESMKTATSVWNTVKDLHLELLLMYHRVCLKLAALKEAEIKLQPKKSKSKKKERSSPSSDRSYEDEIEVRNFEELASECGKNYLSKALLYMESALLSSDGRSYNGKQKTLLDEAVSFILKAQQDEKRTFLDSRYYPDNVTIGNCPPPPLLLSRTDTTMVFRPAPFIPADGQKIAWYRLFARNASGCNVKARLNGYYLPGTGEEVPTCYSEMSISGLTPNERYVFAVAAYNIKGDIIGTIGESTKPILAAHPLPVLMTWAFLVQISYQVGYYQTARQGFGVLWDYFIQEKTEKGGVTYITPDSNDFKLTLPKLNGRAICLSSPVLLRHFLTSIFVSTDVSIREGELFCDVVCDKGPLYWSQTARLAECEKLLVAMELSGWLNEANLALQSVIQCYGLLAPLLFHKIPSHGIIQILQRSHCVLQEIPPGLIIKRQGHIGDSLHHMTACITFHMARSLRTWGQKTLANNINEAGRKLLVIEGIDKDMKQESGEKLDVESESPTAEVNADPGTMTLQALKKKRTRKTGPFNPRDEIEVVVNEELKALEAHILRLTKASQNEMELSGNEDLNILHAYIAFLPARMAHKEVIKFKRRARYLEFVVQVAQKGLLEGFADLVIYWCEDCVQWLQRRDEQIIGHRMYMSKQPGGAITVSGDDPKKFAAAMVEYTKDKETSPPKTTKTMSTIKASTTPGGRTRRRKYKSYGTYIYTSDAARQAQEEKEGKAIEALTLYFADMYRSSCKKRRLRKIYTDEFPYKSQMKSVLGLSYFYSFLQKLEKREKLLGSTGSSAYKSSFLDPEWFTFETAGTLVVGWDGGPKRQSSRHAVSPPKHDKDNKSLHQTLDLASELEKRKTTAIEKAAAAITGIVSSVAKPQQPQESDDTPRTYRSDISTVPESRPTRRQQEDDASLLSTKSTIHSLEKTFNYLKQSVVIAYRGGHWTLLQNACNSLWNCAHTASLRATTSVPDRPESTGLLTVEVLRSLIWRPFYIAVDCLLDMMYKLHITLEQQTQKALSKSKVLGSHFQSWYGEIKNEKGGANLRFEVPLDDRSIVDVRWIRRFVLRTMEMLYHEEKWEKLADIALRFNAISNYRYAEQTLPLLIQAQRKLMKLVDQVGGQAPPQKHYKALLNRLGGVVTAKDYLECQLKVVVDKTKLKPVEPGAHIDPLGHNVYSAEDAQRLISVPLDFDYSLDMFRMVLDQSKYPARSLHHCRKMMVLYLAGQQNNAGSSMPRTPSKVDFMSNTACPQPTAPPSLKNENFLSTDTVQTSPLPRSQLSSVFESYKRSIEILLAKKYKGLASQAMFELGNLYYHTGDLKSTFKWWCDALDVILNVPDAIHSWRNLLSKTEDPPRDLLERCGLWGCLLGGILSSNIAQYILTSDLGLRMDCCFLAGYFFKALFRASMPHPVCDRDYALYDVGEGCEVTSLIPGIDLLSDRFRADGRQLVSALRWVTEELSRGRHNLFVLPLLTLYQYFANFVCRDLQRSVDGRILKVRVLTDLNLFTEAFVVLRRLLHGERLPQIGDSGFRHVESKMGTLQFNTSKPILDVNNLKILESVIDKRLPSNLAALYGPHLTCHLLLVQAHLLVTVANTIPVIPALAEAVVPNGALENQFISIKARTGTVSHVGMGTRAPRLVSATSQAIDTVIEMKDEGSDTDLACYNRRFTDCKKAVTIEIVKATLLNMAEQMVTTLSDVIIDNAKHEKSGKGLEKLPASELELVVLCKLEQGFISRQKHHAPIAARTVLSALQLIQNSNIFKPKKPSKPQPRPSSMKSQGGSANKGANSVEVKLTDPNNSQFQYQNFQSRSRLDTRLWLRCRLELVESLMLEIKGMGDVKGSENKFVTGLADCRQYCMEGVGEAEMFGDIEMQAEFFVQGAFLNIAEGKNLDHTVSILQEALDLLMSVTRLSVPGHQLVVLCEMLITDLELITGTQEDVLRTSLENYIKIQNLVLNQMEALGERIERYRSGKDEHQSSPVMPIANVYLPHLVRLSQLKLRIGHRVTRNAAIAASKGLNDEEALYQWVDAYGVLISALDISRTSVNRDSSIEAEILFDLGKVQKMMMYLGKCPPRKAADTILEAIKISYCTDHNLSLIRQAYLEIGQIYLYSSTVSTNTEDGAGIDSGEETVPSTPTKSSSKPSSCQGKKKWKSKKERSKKKQPLKAEDHIGEPEKERRAAWLAIRCAAATGQAQRARLLLKGNPLATQNVSERASKNIPDFLALDLVGSYILGEKKKVYKNEIEEELSSMVGSEETKKMESYEEQIVKAKKSSQELSWIQVLGYQNILQRMCSSQTVAAFSVPSVKMDEKEVEVNGGDLGPDFDLGFISHAQSSTTSNNDMIRYMLSTGPWVARLTSVHYFLSSSLPGYSECCAIYPPSGLMLTPPMNAANAAPTLKSGSSNMSSSTEQDLESSITGSVVDPEIQAPPGYKYEPFKPIDKFVVSPEDSELCMQWYQPTLEESDPNQPDSPDKKIMLLYASFKMNVTGTYQPGYLWVSLAQLNDLHDRLAVLTQRSEISLADKQKKEVTASTSGTQLKSKRSQRIKALSPKLQRDEQLENLLVQCLEDCALLLSSQLDQDSSLEIPFEVTKSNVKTLEALFDPGLGLTLKNGDLFSWLIKLFPSTNN